MKKVYVSIALAMLLTGCGTTSSVKSNKTEARATNVSEVSSRENLIRDPQLTKYRKSSGKGVWRKEVPKKPAHGNVGSSSDSAFDVEGSARIRFTSADANFYAQPGISQKIKGLDENGNYELSLYYSDKRKEYSNTKLIIEVTNLDGEEIASKTVHISELDTARRGELKSHFHQTFLNFNTGNNTSVKIAAKLKIVDPSKIDLNSDIGKQTEIRVDEFMLIKN